MKLQMKNLLAGWLFVGALVVLAMTAGDALAAEWAKAENAAECQMNENRARVLEEVSGYRDNFVPESPTSTWVDAHRGDARAQYNLGYLYEEGQAGFPQDHVEAARWYRRAAEQGDVHAQEGLGWAYYKGGAEAHAGPSGKLYENGAFFRNYGEAVKWWRCAAKQTIADPDYAAPTTGMLGHMYLEGLGVPQNYRESYIWHSLASMGGGYEQHEREKVGKLLSPAVLVAAQQESARRLENAKARAQGDDAESAPAEVNGTTVSDRFPWAVLAVWFPWADGVADVFYSAALLFILIRLMAFVFTVPARIRLVQIFICYRWAAAKRMGKIHTLFLGAALFFQIEKPSWWNDRIGEAAHHFLHHKKEYRGLYLDCWKIEGDKGNGGVNPDYPWTAKHQRRGIDSAAF